MGLHVEHRGQGPRLVLVHGFTQTGRSWGPVADDLALDHEVLLPDAPGHGGSTGIRADLRAGAELLVDACGPATYVGYSMGGRLCLHAALARPHEVQGLVLLGATGGLDDAADRAARRAADADLGVRLADEGLDAFLERWLAQPLFSRLAADPADLEDRRRNTVSGLRSSLDLAGTGQQEPLWGRLDEIEVPVLVLAGEHDEKFRALAERLAAGLPDATLAWVPDAGHAAHLEQPGPFLELLRTWLVRR